MPKDTSFDERRRQREREDREDEEDRESGASRKRPGSPSPAGAGNGSTEKLAELMGRAEPLIEQLNSLYNQFVAGVEQHPPVEKRRQLDQLMQALQAMSKPGPAHQFRFAALNQSYLTHRDRWERLCKDLESGKIKRPAGPRR